MAFPLEKKCKIEIKILFIKLTPFSITSVSTFIQKTKKLLPFVKTALLSTLSCKDSTNKNTRTR